MDDRSPLRQTEQLETRLLLSSVALTGSTLRVFGDAGVDNVITIGLDAAKTTVTVTVNGTAQTFSHDKVKSVRLFGDSGNDTIRVDESQAKFNIMTSLFGGAAGQNVIIGGDGNDTLIGGDDKDEIFGNAGDDFINGGPDDDTVWGGAGTDTLRGGGGGGQFHDGEFKNFSRFVREIIPKLG